MSHTHPFYIHWNVNEYNHRFIYTALNCKSHIHNYTFQSNKFRRTLTSLDVCPKLIYFLRLFRNCPLHSRQETTFQEFQYKTFNRSKLNLTIQKAERGQRNLGNFISEPPLKKKTFLSLSSQHFKKGKAGFTLPLFFLPSIPMKLLISQFDACPNQCGTTAWTYSRSMGRQEKVPQSTQPTSR